MKFYNVLDSWIILQICAMSVKNRNEQNDYKNNHEENIFKISLNTILLFSSFPQFTDSNDLVEEGVCRLNAMETFLLSFYYWTRWANATTFIENNLSFFTARYPPNITVLVLSQNNIFLCKYCFKWNEFSVLHYW